MRLIDRYVAEVGRRLPRNKRADIARELRSSLLEEFPAGTPSEEDEVALLRRFGPPEKVAASYQPFAHYLIGPSWFPTFSVILRIEVAALLTVAVIGSAVLLAASPSDAGARVAGFVGGVIQTGLIMFGALVVTFHFAERGELRVDARSLDEPREWDPRQLREIGGNNVVGRGEALSTAAFALLILTVLYQLRDTVITLPGWQPVNDVFRDNLIWLAAPVLASIPLSVVLLWRGRWEWPTRVAKVLVDVGRVVAILRLASGLLADQSTLSGAGLPPGLAQVVVVAITVTPVAVALYTIVDASRWLLPTWRERALAG
jgi:hypothetical protein